jgi:hypothetical protein
MRVAENKCDELYAQIVGNIPGAMAADVKRVIARRRQT